METTENKKLASALADVLDTPISPELLPADDEGKIAQKTEDLVGPYELHDFFLYNVLRNGFSPAKILKLAILAFEGKPDYEPRVIYKWLETFYKRFFLQQFKRSCADGRKGRLPFACRRGMAYAERRIKRAVFKRALEPWREAGAVGAVITYSGKGMDLSFRLSHVNSVIYAERSKPFPTAA
jgi:NAD+ synthase (glutamine-hydrolysing)